MTSPAVGSNAAQSSSRPLVSALRRRPQLRAGLIQLVYIAAGVTLGLLIPQITAGPTISSSQVDLVFADLGVAIVALVSVVYTLLFLNVQFAATTYSPRLNLFRDSLLVSHAFGLFIGTLAFTTTSILNTGSGEQVTLLVPLVAGLLVLVSLGVARRLQLSALNSLQLGPVLQSVGERGRAIVDQLYPEPFRSDTMAPGTHTECPYPVSWPQRAAVLRQLHLPGLLAVAQRLDCVVQVSVGVGETLWEHGEIVRLSAAPTAVDELELLAAFDAGIERTFQQDPLLALRLLTDIGLRALSTAINDPYTAIQAIDAIEALLRRLSTQQLDVSAVPDTDGRARVLLSMPDWERFVASGVDELIHFGRGVPSVRQRLLVLLTNLVAVSPPARHAALERRHAELS
jgi:uncharacterized membrane protein